MQLLSIIVLLLAAFACACFAAPADIKDSPKEAKSAFGQPFDEIIVESSLTVKRKSGTRQSRNKDVAEGVSASVGVSKREKREPAENVDIRYIPISSLQLPSSVTIN